MSDAGKWGSSSLQQSSFLLSYGIHCLSVHDLQVNDVSGLLLLPFWLWRIITTDQMISNYEQEKIKWEKRTYSSMWRKKQSIVILQFWYL